MKLHCQSSWMKYLLTVLSSNRLPEQSPKTFAVYIQWLYTGEINAMEGVHKFDSDLPHDDFSCEMWKSKFFMKVAKLAILADQLGDNAFSCYTHIGFLAQDSGPTPKGCLVT